MNWKKHLRSKKDLKELRENIEMQGYRCYQKTFSEFRKLGERLIELEDMHKSNVPDKPTPPTRPPTPKPKTTTQKSLDQLKENGKLLDDIERRVNVLEKKYEKPKIKKDWKPENFKNCFGRFHDWDSGICILCSYKKTCSSTCIDNNARIKVMFKKHEFKTETPPDVKYLDKKEKKPKCFGCESPVAECSSRCVHFEECNIKYNNKKYSSMNIVFYEHADQEEVQKLHKALKNSKLVQGTGITRK